MNREMSTGNMLTRRRFLILAGGAAASAAVSCGGNGGGEFPPSTPGSPPPETTTTPSTPEPIPVMTELRVAYINLLSPVTIDSNNVVAAETFEQRLEVLIEELKQFKPDIVGFSEVFKVTKDLKNAQDLLIAGLKMDFHYARANPWISGQTKEISDENVKIAGFEEGELLLVRPPLSALESQRYAINPRNSEIEGRACLLVPIQAPGPLGKIDVYVTHLTSDNERIRQQQTADILSWIKKTRGTGPAIILGDLNDTPDSAPIATLLGAGFQDIAVVGEGEPGYGTCCRESVLGEQPPLTTRTDYILANGIGPAQVSLLGNVPKKRADGSLLYASDHNGLKAVFPLPDLTTLESAGS